jgi:hypothetical protein
MSIRKIVTVVEEILIEGEKEVTKPTKVAAAMAVIKNPFAGKYVEDLSPLIDEYSAKLGEMLAKRAVQALGVKPEEVEAYGKGALVGSDGEIEHGSAIIHTMLWGHPFRGQTGGGTTLMPAAEKRGAMGASIDVPLKHKADGNIRSHHQTFQVNISDAPKNDEIIVVAAVANSGRPLARIGKLCQEDL